MTTAITPIDQVAHTRAVDMRANQIEADMYRDEHGEDLWDHLQGMLRKASRNEPGARAALEDTTITDLIRAAAKVRATSAVESREVEELASVILGEMRQ